MLLCAKYLQWQAKQMWLSCSHEAQRLVAETHIDQIITQIKVSHKLLQLRYNPFGAGVVRKIQSTFYHFMILKPLGYIIWTKSWPFPRCFSRSFHITMQIPTVQQSRRFLNKCSYFITILLHTGNISSILQIITYFCILSTFRNTENGISQETNHIYSMNLPWILSWLYELKLIYN